MVSRQPHADVAILVLHSSDVGRETFFTSQRWPVRPVVEGRSGLPLGMLGVAPAWAGCGGHACSLRQPHGRMRIGGGASGSGTTRVLDKSLAESPATITGQRSPRRMCRSDLRCPSLPTNRKHYGSRSSSTQDAASSSSREIDRSCPVVSSGPHDNSASGKVQTFRIPAGAPDATPSSELTLLGSGTPPRRRRP